MPTSGLQGLRASCPKTPVYSQATAVLQGLKIKIDFQLFPYKLCYNQLQKTIRDTPPYFGLNGLAMIPPPPLIKDSSNTRPCSKYGGTTLNGG